MFYLNRRYGPARGFDYPMAVVQAFTAASNKYVDTCETCSDPVTHADASFELAIAVCVAIYGVNSDQALAATIGPLVEVPVLLLLTYVALMLGEKLHWRH